MRNESSAVNLHDFALGRQMTVEYYECAPRIIGDGKAMEEIFLRAAVKSGAHVISSHFHNFEPQGVSGVVIISESHFTVHAWPEHDYAAVDIFTCGENIDFDTAIRTLQEGMQAESVIVSSVMNRGIVSNNGMERFVPVFEDRDNRYTLSWERRFNATAAGGISCSIDIYDIFGGKDFDASDIRRFAVDFIEKNTLFAGGSAVSSYQPSSDGHENMMLLYIEDGMKSACGRFMPQEKKLYLDIFSPEFFEPRTIAELLINLLNGSNYRMQVAIRQ